MHSTHLPREAPRRSLPTRLRPCAAPAALRTALAAAALTVALPALAHVSLERPEASPGARYRAVLQVNHGCEGAATTALRVTVPDGLVDARPMPKPGWTLATVRGPAARPEAGAAPGTPGSSGAPAHGGSAREAVREIAWTGGALPDDAYDEFTFVGRVTEEAAPGATLYLPVVQECGGTVRRWTEVPAAGGDARALTAPAPAIRLVAAEGPARRGAAAGTLVKVGDLAVEAPWTRATPAGAKVAGGYVRITNSGTAPDRLVGGTFAAAGRVEVHSMTNEGGVMRMAPVEGGLEIKPGTTVELRPGGYHLMFMDLAAGLKEGETVRGTLVFERAGTVAVEFPVGAVGARGAAAGGHDHH